VYSAKGPLADRAWEIIEGGFDDWSSKVADVKKAMVCAPFNKIGLPLHVGQMMLAYFWCSDPPKNSD
jgi:hypothetical protein